MYVAMEPKVVSEEAEYGQVTLRCELASGHPAILTNVTWYKVRVSDIYKFLTPKMNLNWNKNNSFKSRRLVSI